jgi:hypothetical protein
MPSSMERVLHSVAVVLAALADLREGIAGVPSQDEFCPLVLCISGLEDALHQQFELPSQPSRRSDSEQETKLKMRKVQRSLRSKQTQLQCAREIVDQERAQKVSGRIANLWYVRAGLSAASVSVRTLGQWCRDYPTCETKNISRFSITQVRNAMAEIIKELNGECVTALAASRELLHVEEMHWETKAFYLPHVHDEATMGEVRSYLHDVSLPTALQSGLRGKSSKIQNHVLEVKTATETQEVYTELQALHKKDGVSVAYSIIQTVGCVIEQLTKAFANPQGAGHRKVIVRVIHLITGDAVNTNGNACRRVFLYFTVHSRRLGIRYSVICTKCGSHQANLVVQVAICGTAMANPIDDNLLCGTCSRLFKYLIPDYLEEFAANLRTYVLEEVHLVHDVGSLEAEEACSKAYKLQALYGEAVLPPALLSLCNRELRKLEILCAPGTDRQEKCAKLFQLLYRLLLKLQVKPIVTRFFLFGDCVFTLLLMDLLGIPGKVFHLNAKTAMPDNVKRLKKVHEFFACPQTPMDLRKASLCLQLTLHAVSMTAQTVAKEQESRPLIVRLSQGEVQKHTSAHLARLAPLLQNDPDLDVLDAILALWTTEGHIVIRFAIYQAYPYLLWKLVRKFNPIGYALEIQEFLAVPEEQLDVGYSAQIKAKALASGSEADAVSYLMAEPMQEEMQGVLEKIVANSLSVERRHNRDKPTKGGRASSVGTASRNSIHQHYAVKRNKMIEHSISEHDKAYRNKFLGLRALAIQKMPWLWERPKGKLWWQVLVDMEEAAQKVGVGDEPALQAYIEENRAALKAEAAQIRARAQAILSNSYAGGMPYTNGEWLSWLEANSDRFRHLLREATEKRKCLARRLQADEELPPAQRLQPQDIQEPPASWKTKLAHCKSGVVGVVWGDGPDQKLVCFSCSLWNRPWCLPLQELSAKLYCWDSSISFATAFKPISTVLESQLSQVRPEAVHVFSLALRLDSTAGSLFTFRVCSYTVVEDVPARVRATSQKTDGSDEEVEGFHDRDTDSEVGSVATDVETEAEEEAEEDGAQSQAEESSDELEVGPRTRARQGTHRVFNNGYFTLTNDRTCWPGTALRKYNDCKIRILPRWAKDSEMGARFASKNAKFEDFADDAADPIRSYLVLRAWMLGRMKEKQFCEAKKCRKQFHARELTKLSQDIAALRCPGGGTGNEEADTKIRLWAPEALMAGS